MLAIVIGKQKGRTLVEVLPDEACAGCSACSRSQGGKVLLVHADEDYERGTHVEIEMEDSQLLAASFIAYGIPLFVFFASLYLLFVLFSRTSFHEHAEILSFFGSLALLALTYALIYVTDAKRIEEGRFNARIVKKIEVKEEPCHFS